MKTRRRFVQLAFLLLTVVGVFVLRSHAERWCPFGGVEAAYTYAREGNMLCSLGVSNFYILASLLLVTLLFRRAFCGYACPIGAISELLQAGARRAGIKPRTVSPRLDSALSLIKYPLLGIILFFTWRSGELVLRGYDPCYALLGRHGEDITNWAYVISGALIIVSLLVTVPFCRWLCPMAVVFQPFSRFGLTRIKRDGAACVGCAKCAKVCPMAIPVDELNEVTAARCTSCLDCVSVCPAQKKGALSWGPPRARGRSWSQPAMIGAMVLTIALAVAATEAFPIPSFVQNRGALPEGSALVDVQVEHLTCRGRGSLLWYYLTRDDLFGVAGPIDLAAWPGPGLARVRVGFDPALTDGNAIRTAIVEPYFDAEAMIWRPSPFVIEGFDPLGLDEP